MTEPYDTVYVSQAATRRIGSYHRADRNGFPVETFCGRLQLIDCAHVPEIEAALKHEPCLRCFPVRGRRQRILNEIVVAGVEDA